MQLHELLLVQLPAVVEIEDGPRAVDEPLIDLVAKLIFSILPDLCLADGPRRVRVNLLERAAYPTPAMGKNTLGPTTHSTGPCFHNRWEYSAYLLDDAESGGGFFLTAFFRVFASAAEGNGGGRRRGGVPSLMLPSRPKSQCVERVRLATPCPP